MIRGARQILLAFLMTLAVSGLAQAQSDNTSRTTNQAFTAGIVDVNGVMDRSVAINKIREVIDEETRKFQEIIERENDELRQAEADLTAQRDILDENEFNRRKKDFENRVLRIQQDVQIQRRNFDKVLRQADDQVRKLLLQIISEIASERGFSIVLQRQDVVIFDTGFDISDEVLVRLDEQTKDVKITLSGKDRDTDGE